MNCRTIGFVLAVFFVFRGESWAQKNPPTVRIGIEAPAGTNSHYFVTKQMGLFQKHGVNIELISFPGGTVGLQALFAGDIQFTTSDGDAGLSGKPARRQSLFYRRHDQHVSFQYSFAPGDSHASGTSRQKDRDQPLWLFVGHGGARGGGKIRSQTGQGRDHPPRRRPERTVCRAQSRRGRCGHRQPAAQPSRA